MVFETQEHFTFNKQCSNTVNRNGGVNTLLPSFILFTWPLGKFNS